jgi:GxxExxY protein
MKDYKHADLTRVIIGCAMKVHRIIGPGFPEIIYRRCLVIELRKAGLLCEVEVEKDIFYEGEKVGSRRLDILVEKLVILELKAINEIEPLCYSQVLDYLKIFNIEVGLLLNFGNISLHYKRFANTR